MIRFYVYVGFLVLMKDHCQAQNQTAACSNGGPVKRLNRPTDFAIRIFPNLTFGCSGNITKWTFYAHNSGTFYVSAWRKVGHIQFRLLGVNKITVNSAGVHEVITSKEDQIEVLDSDIIGTYEGVISFERPGSPRTAGVTDGQLHEFGLGWSNRGIHAGNTYYFNFRPPATVALRANIGVLYYDCGENNPCNPRAVSGKDTYANSNPRRFVRCRSSGRCTISSCKRRAVYNDDIGACVNP